MKHKTKDGTGIKILKTLSIALIVLLFVGCTARTELSEEDENKTKICTDIRDGEVFSFNTNTVTNMRAGFGAPSTFDMVTTGGKKMTLSSAMAAYLKCVDE